MVIECLCVVSRIGDKIGSLLVAGSIVFIVWRWARRRCVTIWSCVAWWVDAVLQIVTKSATVVADNVWWGGLVAVLMIWSTVGRWAVIQSWHGTKRRSIGSLLLLIGWTRWFGVRVTVVGVLWRLSLIVLLYRSKVDDAFVCLSCFHYCFDKDRGLSWNLVVAVGLRRVRCLSLTWKLPCRICMLIKMAVAQRWGGKTTGFINIEELTLKFR